MDRERLKNVDCSYFKMDIPPVDAVCMYSNMEALLVFIGTHREHNRWNALGNAYYELRKRTDKKLKVSRWMCRSKLRTSKSEVKALVCAKKKPRNSSIVEMRIPYKSYYILESIVDCVDELVFRDKVEIPQDLRPLCGELYRIAFMKRQIDLYETEFRSKKKEWEQRDFIAWYLHDDFFASGSPFNKKFTK